jgi:hypothetical protein
MSKIKVNSIEAATGSTITIPSGQTLDISSTTLTLPSTVVTTTGTQTLTNKTIGVSQLTGTLPVANGGTGLTTLGSASQVLRVNSGATALEFATPAVASSDFVLLATTDANDTATKVSFDGYFSSTYKNYKLIGSNITIASGQTALRVRFRRSNADITAAYYYTVAVRYYIVDGGLTAVGGTGESSALLVNENTSSTAGYNSSFTLDLYDPFGTNNYKNATFQTIGYDAPSNDNRHHFENGALGLTDNTSALSGITIDQAAGVNIKRGNFKLYGIK